MTVTEINDRIDELIEDIEGLTHIDVGELTELRNTLEDVQEKLDQLSEQYGDEPGEIEDDE